MLGIFVVFRRLFEAIRSGVHDAAFRGLLGLTASTLLAGTVVYWRLEDWTWFESLYFSVITLTTVGYGDFSPQTTGGRAFTIVSVMLGLGIVIGLVTDIARHAARSRNPGTA